MRTAHASAARSTTPLNGYFRLVSSPVSDELPEREWQPSTENERFECVEAALTRLSDIAKRGMVDLQADLVAAAQVFSMRLREPSVRDLVARFYDAIRAAYPEAREPLRRIVASIVHDERTHWKELSDEELGVLEALHARFEDSSLGARLQQHVGQAAWDQEEQVNLKPLAEELLSAPEALAEHWPWLTSGDASDALRLGEALAEVDAEGGLAEILPVLPGGGRDLRLLCGYIRIRRQALGDEWYDDWIASQIAQDPKLIDLLFEVACRCGTTEAIANMVAAVLRSEQVSPQVVGQLSFGRWGENLAIGVLQNVLRAMADNGHRKTAIGILRCRMKANSVELERWKPLALALVTASDLIRSRHTTSYHWKEVANIIVADYPQEIAAAIFREQADRRLGGWFAEHSEAAGVLLACVKKDPRGCWQEMQPYLSSPTDAYRFSIGLPRGVLERMPPDDVVAWIAEQPEDRAAMMGRLTSKSMATDGTLASRIIGAYGDSERVARAFFSDYVSGSWSGSPSSHWEQLAQSLDAVAGRTALPKLRRWASDSARSLREMAKRDRQREEEEDLRGW